MPEVACDPNRWADAFHVPGKGPYALTHSVGCLPWAARTALESGLLVPWIERGGEAWPCWLEQIEHFRAALAALFGGSSSEYCPQSNLSSGLSKVLSCLPRDPNGRRLLVAAEDSFPSLGFVLGRAQRLGYDLRLIPRAEDPSLVESWSRALTNEVRAVLVTHVHSNTGGVAPIREIARMCAERDVLCIVDVAQSAGILPLSFPEIGAQIVLGSCIKWLCGGPGAGFLWMPAADAQSLEPADDAWFSQADPYEHDNHSFAFAPDSRRFWGGTPTISPFVTAAASLGVIRDLGVANILDYNRRLMEVFKAGLDQSWRGRLPDGEMGGTLCIRAGAEQEKITAALRTAAVFFDCRGEVIRLSFHACNREEEAARVARAWMEGSRQCT
jgi:selenocysteine lyase/cysteine desulfurase